MAEEAVARHVEARGLRVLARRWRGAAGEIDLVCRDGACIVFIEVKQAGSHDAAALRLMRPQMDRICAAACEYCAALPDGLLTEMRFDVALVDSVGRVDILQNAFAED
ncbi:YraN family protein [Paracoccus salsus]|uniref:YraN family protein n=1 Tax=Paracoccus salsus TaxID=2911061 RepID=UPI001F31E1E6|nr:YraN family protein [Paracoccus salsus]MCF3973455.1 YraN family protein [Paracoccus salsus]